MCKIPTNSWRDSADHREKQELGFVALLPTSPELAQIATALPSIHPNPSQVSHERDDILITNNYRITWAYRGPAGSP